MVRKTISTVAQKVATTINLSGNDLINGKGDLIIVSRFINSSGETLSNDDHKSVRIEKAMEKFPRAGELRTILGELCEFVWDYKEQEVSE